MPISPENRAKYPPGFFSARAILEARNKAGWKCENCDARHGLAHPETGAKVVLTRHHVNGDIENTDAEILLLCQLCHNRADASFRAHNRRQRRARQAGQGELEVSG